ncbi:cysteine hydrolase family protein [Nocardioides sp.]|uniref:cysteine hydrolase family protein n=1 Tax=Nocardioides sp. TaxID=35761 RepID=UPI002607A02C|nr:cysteine hydrolase family protein [Nocardioides sp.]
MTHSEPTALVVVDMQQGFDDASWGRAVQREECDRNVVRLLDAWTDQGWPIVVVRHDSVHQESPLRPAHPGNALLPAVAAARADLLVTKTVNSAFYGTPDLDAWLRGEGIGRIVVCGIQTNMCVETTARMGGNLGYEVVVPLDATSTFDLAGPDGTVLPAEELIRATTTNLHGGGFAQVVTTSALLAQAR